MEECLCVFSSVLKAEIVDMPFQISEHGTPVPGPDVHGWCAKSEPGDMALKKISHISLKILSSKSSLTPYLWKCVSHIQLEQALWKFV